MSNNPVTDEQAVEELPVFDDAPVLDDAMIPEELDAPSADPFESEMDAKLDALIKEFGEENVTDIVVDVSFDPAVADFIQDAKEAMVAKSESMAGKARFFVHREPNSDLYLLHNLKPSEWKTQWLQLLTGQQEAYEAHADDVLKATMLYPSFDETDWEYEGNKMNRPLGLTKTRLIGTFMSYEMQDPNQDNSVAFDSKSIDTALKAASRASKPSL